MNRLPRRVSILTVGAICVTAVWTGVAYALVFGKSPVAGGVAVIGLMFFLPTILIFMYELHRAYSIGSYRDDLQDRRILALERKAGFHGPRRVDPPGPGPDDTPPHGISVADFEDDE